MDSWGRAFGSEAYPGIIQSHFYAKNSLRDFEVAQNKMRQVGHCAHLAHHVLFEVSVRVKFAFNANIELTIGAKFELLHWR